MTMTVKEGSGDKSDSPLDAELKKAAQESKDAQSASFTRTETQKRPARYD